MFLISAAKHRGRLETDWIVILKGEKMGWGKTCIILGKMKGFRPEVNHVFCWPLRKGKASRFFFFFASSFHFLLLFLFVQFSYFFLFFFFGSLFVCLFFLFLIITSCGQWKFRGATGNLRGIPGPATTAAFTPAIALICPTLTIAERQPWRARKRLLQTALVMFQTFSSCSFIEMIFCLFFI